MSVAYQPYNSGNRLRIMTFAAYCRKYYPNDRTTIKKPPPPPKKVNNI